MDSNYIGVKFYSNTDFSIGYNLESAEKVIKNFDVNNTRFHINSILELHNICLLFETEVRLKKWDDEYYSNLKLIVSKFRQIIGRFMSKINYEKLKSFYSEISVHYIDNFWKLFETYKVYKKISLEEFTSIMEEFNVQLHFILKHKKIVQKFDNEISAFMEKSESTPEILISHHLAKKDKNSKRYYIPDALKIEQQIKIIDNYIEKEDANPNYLLLLVKSRYTKDFPISDKIRLKSKKRYYNYMTKSFKSDTGFSFGATIGFSDSDEMIVYSLEDKLNPKIIYSRLWIKENLDNPTLLNNFIYLFRYVDRQFRSTFPSNKNHIGNLERIIGVKGNREYEFGAFFRLYDMMSSMKIRTYYHELLILDKKLEDIFKWFFEEYLKNEFHAEGFYLNVPSSESSFLEKMRTMCSEFDSILRQYTNYVNNGEIDRELIEISRNTPVVEDIPSFFSKKYCYLVDNNLLDISYLLFSDQSLLNYIENRKEYKNFVDLIKSENVLMSDFFEYQIQILTNLIKKDIIYEDDEKYIRLKLEIVSILKDFYENEVISLFYYKDNDLIYKLISTNKIICSSALFSKPEQEYLNFILNDRFYDNGPAIRNKYMHGNNCLNSDEHENDYFQLLKIIVLFIIKINEEFCLRDEHKNNKNV